MTTASKGAAPAVSDAQEFVQDEEIKDALQTLEYSASLFDKDSYAARDLRTLARRLASGRLSTGLPPVTDQHVSAALIICPSCGMGQTELPVLDIICRDAWHSKGEPRPDPSLTDTQRLDWFEDSGLDVMRNTSVSPYPHDRRWTVGSFAADLAWHGPSLRDAMDAARDGLLRGPDKGEPRPAGEV